MSERVRLEIEKGVYREENHLGEMVTVYDLRIMTPEAKERYGFIKPDRGESIAGCDVHDKRK